MHDLQPVLPCMRTMAEPREEQAGPSKANRRLFCSTATAARGKGYGSRFKVSENELPAGWRCEQKSKKCTLWYDDKGTQYRSSIAVERELRKRRFIPASDEEATGIETGGETSSEYDPSPLKTPRMMELGSILSCSVDVVAMPCLFPSCYIKLILLDVHILSLYFQACNPSKQFVCWSTVTDPATPGFCKWIAVMLNSVEI